MRVFVLWFVVAISTRAFAQPGPEAPPPAQLAPHYVALDLTVGGYDTVPLLGVSAEAGVRLGDSPMWLHAQASTGGVFELLSNGSGNFWRASVGLEARGCVGRGALCAIGGADMGAMYATYTGTTTGLFDNDAPASPTTTTAQHLVAIPRIGVDLGGATVRGRLTVELPVDVEGPNNSDGTLVEVGVAFGW